MNILKFSEKEESQFRLETYKNNLKFIRITMFVCMFFYSVFALVDLIIKSPSLMPFLFIRFIIIDPIFLMVIILSYHKSFYKYHQLILAFAYVCAGLGIIAMFILEPKNYSYYCGLFLIFATGHLLVRIRLMYISVGSIIIVIAYLLVAMFFLHEHNPDAYIYLIFYIGILILNIFGSYTYDKHEREKFKQVYLLRNNMVSLKKNKVFLEAHIRNQQKLESIGVLAGGVAHEINNPINGIMNYAQLIKDSSNPNSEISEYSNEILHETDRVSAIVKNLLQFSRNDNHQYSYSKIEEIVNATTSLTKTIIQHDQITLQIDIPKNLPELKCRSQQIQQVIMNLLTNSRDALNEKYSGYHEDKVIKLNCEQYSRGKSKWIKITIEDRGKGIPKDILSKIFDPFFTTKERDKGTGLGLSISYGIVNEHNGELTCESEEGKYTRFFIDLPCDND